MEQKGKSGVLPKMTRRRLLGTASTAAGATAVLSVAPWASVQAEVDQLKREGWDAHPVACNMCGGYCGMLAMHKKGAPVTRENVRMMPNPSHPQRGYCARGASAMWMWDHPLRLKKPLMRTGERGEGAFKEVSWDEALNEIAKRVKAIVDKDGERAIAMTSHNFTAYQKWFGAALGTPNIISHSSTCNSASVMGRRMVFGKGFDGAGKVEPDYANARMLLCVGRTLNCAMGIHSVVAGARDRGCRVVFVDPRMPEGAFTGSKWVPIKPGTDAAFILAMLNIAIQEKLADENWLAKHTNAAYLVREDNGLPVSEADVKSGGNAKRYAVVDASTKRMHFQGVKFDDKGKAVGFEEDADLNHDLRFRGSITLASGESVSVKTAYLLFAETAAKYTPEEAAKITGIPSADLIALTREFFALKGVVDDGWYSARNGNDTEAFALISILNLFTGTFDQVGGCVITAGGGFGGVKAGASGTKGTGPKGQTWTIPDGKALDKVYYPEGAGTFSAIFDAIHTAKPYPVRGVFVTGSTMFHREANSDRLAKAMKALDLLVVQDILPHEIIDYADFVLPCTYFMEGHEYCGVKWALNGNVQLSDAGLEPPAGVDARDEIWQFCEILRRAYPDRAAERLGYDTEMKTREEFKSWYRGMMDNAWAKFIQKKNEDKPGEGDRIAREVAQNGWAQTTLKKYGVYPYVKPFGTPTGKAEIISFLCAQKYADKGLAGMSDYEAPKGYRAPKALSDEFVLVSGKDANASSGVTLFTKPSQFLGDRTVWMNPIDADRLGLKTGDGIELTGLDTGVKGRSTVKVTNRVMAGVLFSHGFSGGVRTKTLAAPGYEWVREGVNSHWFCTGYREPVVGSLANNCSVRVTRI